MPALPFASFHGPVDGVRRFHNKKRQLGTPKPPARVGFAMGNPDPQPEDLPIQLGDPDEEIPASGISDSPTIFAGLPTAPITVTLISTVTNSDPAPTLSIPASVSNDPSAVPTVSPSPSAPAPSASAPEQSALSSDIPVASPSVSVVPSSDPVPQPSDVIVEPSNVISSDIPQPSAPADTPQPPPPPPPSAPASSPSGSVSPVASPTAPMQSGGGIMLSDNNSPPSISGGLVKSSKMPTGAIVGIVIGIIAVLLLAGIFLARKTLLKRRHRIHIGDNMSWPEEKSFGERFVGGGKTNNGTVTPYPFTAPVSTGGSGPRQQHHHQPQMSIARVPPPPITPSIAPPHFSSAATQPPVPPPYLNNGVLSPSVAPLGLHTVRSTFATTLPDELNIRMGEKINVLTVYDDGWALCQRAATGEQGMAPMECLVADGTSINVGRAGSLRSVV